MTTVVCIKQVPDGPNIRIDRERMTIIRDGVESLINPLDRVALEAALDLKQKEGGKISVLTMGPSQSEEALREAMAAGADQAMVEAQGQVTRLQSGQAGRDFTWG